MFKLWCKLPFDLRKMIIDRMDSKTRCMFAGVSFECFQDFCSSMDCIEKIRISSRNNGYIVWFYYEKIYCFAIGFSKIDETTTLKYFLLAGSDKFCWTQEENNEFEEQLGTIFDRCKRTLQEIEIDVKDFPTESINIRNFGNLQKIHLKTENTVDFLDSRFVKLEQLLSAKTSVSLSNTKLTTEQIIQIPKLYIDQMDLTEQDILEYMIFLKNLKTEEMRCLTINMKDQKNPLQFSIKQKFLDIFENDHEMRVKRSVNRDKFELIGRNHKNSIMIHFETNHCLNIFLESLDFYSYYSYF